MTDLRGPYRNAVLLAGLSALLHAAALGLGGWTGTMAVGLGLWSVLAWGMAQGWRLAAWGAFLLGLFGTSISMSLALNAGGAMALIFWAMTAADAGVALVLLAVLWRPRPV